MPGQWWLTEVRPHSGNFTAMNQIFVSPAIKREFNREWLPRLLAAFTQHLPDGGTRLLANRLALDIGGEWRRCNTCKSVHRPIPGFQRCVDCGSDDARAFDPSTDEVFRARKAFYRDPVID